ncbi:MAG: nicotinamide riboside transporter PnuC [Clostridia bacterium]|nr:nicotinamide riboside transporter PnuC [Clostridia bacterium]
MQDKSDKKRFDFKAEAKKFFKKLNAFDIIVYCSGLALLAVMRIFFDAAWLSVVSVLFSLTGGIFNSKRYRIHNLLSTTSALFYVYICFDGKLYGEAILYLCVIVPLYIAGFVNWNKNRTQKLIDEVYHIKPKALLILAGICLVTVLGYGSILKYLLNANQPFMTALSSSLCVCAVYLTSKRYLEQWYCWLICNAVLLAVWLTAIIRDGNTSGYSLLVQNCIFIAININGLITWKKLEKYLLMEFSEEYKQ